MAGLARHGGFGLDRRRKAVQRRPVIGAGGAENAHGRRADRRRDMHQPEIVGDRSAGCRDGQDAVAQIGAGEVADPWSAGRDDLGRKRLLAGAADHPDVQPLLGEQPRRFRIIGPAFGRADRARRQRHGRGGSEIRCLPPAADFRRGNHKLRYRPFRRQRCPIRQRQRGVLVDETGQGLFAPAPSIEQAEPGFPDKTYPLRNSGQRRRNRRFPGSGQHQRGAVLVGPELAGEPPLLGNRQPASWQVPDDASTDSGHIIDQRGTERCHQDIHGPVRPALLQYPHHGVATDEVADPHVRHDQDRPGVVPGPSSWPDILNLDSYDFRNQLGVIRLCR